MPGISTEVPQRLMARVLEGAARRLGVGIDQIQVERVEATTWGDSSLGCPRPGMVYAQVITPGYRIVVSNGGRRLVFHTDSRDDAVLCQR